MYQLKDGAYLRLSFSIVVDADKLGEAQEIIEVTSPGRLPDSIHMFLGNKTGGAVIQYANRKPSGGRR